MYSWIMEQNEAIKALTALAHDGRLSIVRSLIQAGADGMLAGEIGRHAGIQATTASAQLLVLANAGLVSATRDGRNVLYTAQFSTMSDLLSFLMLDCCCGSPTICGPITDEVQS